MCEIPDDYIHVDDVEEMLESLKPDIESSIDEKIYELTHRHTWREEPLREMEPISDELERKVQARIDKLPRQQSN